MSASPRTVAVSTTFTWDGGQQYLHRGQVIDVTPDSALERAIGRERLVSLRGFPLPPPVEPANSVEPAGAAPAKARAAAKKQDNGKDGAS